jgi:5-methyltetrahydropteroyltriglutamate--homocysteine methyltransferase
MNNSIETTVIGSYPVAIDTSSLMQSYYQGIIPSWKPYIEKAVTSMKNAGITLISDGQTRDPFIHIFIRGLGGCRIRQRAEVIGPIFHNKSITANDLAFVRSILPASSKVLGLLVGPFTLSESVVNSFYSDKKQLAFDFAEALKMEALCIEPYVDMISVDEPFFSNVFPEYAKELISIITKPLSCPTRLHSCGNVSSIISDLVDFPVSILSHEFKATPILFDVFQEYPSSMGICLGSVRSDNQCIESVEEIEKHIQRGKEVFGTQLKQIAPDCGLRMLPSDIAFKKLRNLVQAGENLYG